MADNGGIVSADDLASYRPVERQPIVTHYRDFTVIGFPPPSSGGIHVAQILNILANFDLRALHQRDPALVVHVVAEAMKLAFADRAHWLGDSDFVPVPRGLLDTAYARQLARRIRLDQVLPVDGHGVPPDWESNVFGKHTTHIATADAEGNWVGLTATINTSFGSKVIVPGTGLLLNNQMDDFSAQPGVPNAFGLIGNQHNAIAAGKRPLSSMSPTIVLRDGRPVMTFGAAGGPRIITQVVLGIVQAIDLQMPLADCVANARWHHQWRPNQLFVEPTLPEAIRQRLVQLGHSVAPLSAAGVMQAIGRSADGQFIGVHDPRVPGQALAF
jgi:gamma-glutamyltranspeptidase/glutathione hydrolase